ncbi:MAG: tRNA1(Val) (adenine(37)-N6)-methyltransferase [Bacillota bacterium]|jgi:tRNA1Val (adenine37-N6)-methyltransferase
MPQSGERIDDLLWRNLKIIQNPDWFCFSLDAVLLSAFATLRPGDLVVDLGTGTGVIPILLNARYKKTNICGLEIKPEVAEMAQRSVILNGLTDHIVIRVGDIKSAAEMLGKGRYDLVVSNPPYALVGSGKISFSSIKAAARSEILCTLEDVVREASLLLNSEGRFALVHRPTRLADIISLMRNYRLEPKRMRLVYPGPEKEPNLVLIEGIKNGKRDVQVLPPLFVYQKTGVHSEEMKAIFQGKILTEEW